ncbi:MAG: DMT family transporter [Anaerolineales bacterium]|jgi:drug/metabolite transporter (DMT)-like permease
MSSKQNFLAYGALGVAILAISFSAFFVRWANVPPQVMGFYRIGLSTLMLSPFFMSRTIRRQGGPSALDLRWGILLFPILAGLASAMDQFIWNTSLKFTQAANATLLGNTSPLWVALIAWVILRERTRRLFWLGLVLVMGGAAVVLGNDFLRHPTLGWGDLLSITSAFFYGLFYLFSQQSRRRLDTLSHVWLCSLSSTLVLLVICLVSRTPLSGYPTRSYVVMLGAALLPQLTGYLAIGYALGHIPAAIASPTMLGQPVITAILAIPILGERLTPPQWIGGLVALTGIYLVNRSREKPIEAVPIDEAPPLKGSTAEGKGRQTLDRRLDPK